MLASQPAGVLLCSDPHLINVGLHSVVYRQMFFRKKGLLGRKKIHVSVLSRS